MASSSGSQGAGFHSRRPNKALLITSKHVAVDRSKTVQWRRLLVTLVVMK